MKDKITTYCNSLGLDLVGFVPCRPFIELESYLKKRQAMGLINEFEEADISLRIHPNRLMESGQTIISIAFPYYYESKDSIDNGFSIYTKGADYHRVVHGYLSKICAYIEALGGSARAFTDSTPLPERYIACLAGIGFIGRNQMLITKKYGSYVFLGEIITDLKLIEGERPFAKDNLRYQECGDCQSCLTACPTKAISKQEYRSKRCLSYLTQKKDLSNEEMMMLRGNLFGCDICQKACPYNQGIPSGVLKEFEPLPAMNQPVSFYATMDNAFFKNNLKLSSCGWRGKNIIIRNAMIRLHREKQDISSLQSQSSYINEYKSRLLQMDDNANNNREK